MNTFLGQYEARLDDKGRTFIPAAYRKILAEYGSGKVVIRRDPANKCLIFYPEQVFNEQAAQLQSKLSRWQGKDRLAIMKFMAGAQYQDPDNQGRVLIQKNDREHIQAESDVLFVGMLDCFALWAPKLFEESMMPDDDFETLVEGLMTQP